MTIDGPTPEKLIGSGRAADVFDIGDGKVLRRYREPNERTAYESRVMRFVAENGVPVPRVFDLAPHHHADRDIVMERIDGVTMLEDLERRPWKLLSHARLLAALHHQITSVPAPDWMMSPGWAMVPGGENTHSDGVLHLDLHPMNVMISREGAVVIDWSNATGGPAGFDAALSYVEMATFETETPKDRLGLQVFVAAFRRAVGHREVDAFLTAACDHRLADSGVTPGERVNVAALRKKAITGTGRTRPRS